MKTLPSTLAAASTLLLFAGCASVPIGPSVMALPGSGKSFEQFRSDDAECRQYAQYQVGGADANQAAMDAGLRSAAVGTVVGALAGAAMGGNHQGSGAGAGAGLVVGSMAGAGAAQSSARGTQMHYDHAYIQCMYAKGEQVPVSGSMPRSRVQAPAEYVQPAPAAYPPPPQGNPPPPPPGYLPPPPTR